MISAVIFAGGKSSRMGRDKALLPLGSHSSMAALQYHKLRQHFDRVYLSSKDAKFDFDAPLLLDHYPEHSPMVALASVLEQTEEEALFILSVDMPRVDTPVIQQLLHSYNTDREHPAILIAKSPRGIEPLCGIYRREVLPVVQTLLHQGEHRMRSLLQAVTTATVSFESLEAFVNLNTPQEYQAIHP